MSDDLVKRLREDAEHIRNQPDYIGSPDYSADLALKAAARIERLEALLTRAISEGGGVSGQWVPEARAALKEGQS